MVVQEQAVASAVNTTADDTASASPADGPAGLPGLAELRRIAIIPALNEADSIGRVIDDIRAFDPGFFVLVVDDGSSDQTAAVAQAHGARVVQLPFNLGIGGAMQTGYRYAFENDFDIAVQIDADGQHEPGQLPSILAPVLAARTDVAVGSRFAGMTSYRVPLVRRVGIRLFDWALSALVRQRITDPTSGFRAVNRRGIALFAADYPHDYPEVEATVMLYKHQLTLCEVPVTMKERSAGRSSITAFRSVYYMVKVMLAIFIGMFRSRVLSLEEK